MKNDINKDKWLGIGGKFEEGESPEECIIREVKEETGLTVIPETIKAYGMVHRIQKGDYEDVFIQDNYYYLCDVKDERFTLEYVTPQQIIDTNRRCVSQEADQIMIAREIRMLEILQEEGYF